MGAAGATPLVAALPPISPIHYAWIGAALLVGGAAIYWLGAVLAPFVAAAILAYIGSPIVAWLERRGVGRTLGALLVLALMLAAIVGLLLVLIPLVQREVLLVLKRVPDLASTFNRDVVPWLELHLGIRLQFDLATIRQFVTDNLEGAQALSVKVLSSLRIGGMALVGFIVTLSLIPVVLFYLLRDWDEIRAHLDQLIPRPWLGAVRGLATEVDQVLAEFLRGQVSVMVALAIYYGIALSVVGLDLALPVGVLTGLLVFIPYVGYGLGLILALAAGALQFGFTGPLLAVAAVYGVGQLLENFVLVPWLVGDRIGLHPLAVIFALLAFGELFGFVGVLLALPVSAALLVGLRQIRRTYQRSPLYGGRD